MRSSHARLVGIVLLATPLCSAGIVPISVVPSEAWDGNDGPWSSFAIRIGTPEQVVRVFPSTAVQASWVVLPEGCQSSSSPDCTGARGTVFYPNRSTTWQEQGYYELGFEPNLNRSDGNTGYYGYDQMSLGWAGSGGPTLQNQSIAGISTSKWYLGVLGLNPQSINLTDFNDPKPSLLSSLRAKGNISSLSYGYTAGAPYRGKTFLGSLTLGGYDASRFVHNGVRFTFAPSDVRDLVVAIQSVNIATTTGTHSALNGSLTPTLAYIDSTLPHIWLPLSACKVFEAAFGITWDSTTDLYLVNDTLHQALLSMNASVTFHLGNTPSGGPTVEIILPYASFDLSVSQPIVANTTRYFPLRRANDSQVTLGRAFLQESYLTADYERRNFSIAQTVFNDSAPQELVAITPPGNNSGAITPPSNNTGAAGTRATGTQSLPSGAVAGIVIGIVLLISLGIFLVIRHRKRKAKRLADFRALQAQNLPDWKKAQSEVLEVAEIDGQPLPVEAGGTPRHEMAGEVPGHEMAGSTSPVYELAVDEPVRPRNGEQRSRGEAR